MTLPIFINKSGRPLRIHLDMKNIPRDAILKLGQEIEGGGGDITFNASKSDVLIVDPMHHHVFNELLGDLASDQRPTVVLAFWVPLCRISSELVWFNHPHWDSVYLPYHTLPCSNVPIGLRLYKCFLAGRSSAALPSSELATTAPELLARVILDTNDSEHGIYSIQPQPTVLDSSSPGQSPEVTTNGTTTDPVASLVGKLSPPASTSTPQTREHHKSAKLVPLVTPSSSPTTATSFRALTKRPSIGSGLKILTKGNPKKPNLFQSNHNPTFPVSTEQKPSVPAVSNGSGATHAGKPGTIGASSVTRVGTRPDQRSTPKVESETLGKNVLDSISKSVNDGQVHLNSSVSNLNEAPRKSKASSGLRITSTGAFLAKTSPIRPSATPDANGPGSQKTSFVVSSISTNGVEANGKETVSPVLIESMQASIKSIGKSNLDDSSLPNQPSNTNPAKSNGVRFKSPVADAHPSSGSNGQVKGFLKPRSNTAPSVSSDSHKFPPAPGRQTPPPTPPEILPESSSSVRRQWLRDDEYIISFMNWVFKQDPKASTAEIMLDIAKRLPHHSNDGWRRRFATYEGEKFIHRVPILFERYHNRTSSVDPRAKSSSQSITPPSSQSITPPTSQSLEPPPVKEPMPRVPVTPPELINSKKFTDEEDHFVMEYMNWWFKQDPEASTDEIMEDIALLLPRHSVPQWKLRYRSLEDTKYMVGVPELFRRLMNRSSGPEAGLPPSLDFVLARQRGDPHYVESSDEGEPDSASGTKRRKTPRQSGRFLSGSRDGKKKPRLTI